MKTFAIADMHGRLDLFMKAWSIIRHHAGAEDYQLVVMGDFVDRGPESAQLIAELRQLQNFYDDKRIVILKGNHEDMMVQCDNQRAQLMWWIGNGGGQTLMSYGYKQGDMLLPHKGNLASDLEWLDNLPLYYDNGVQVFVHAAVDPQLPLDQQNPEYVMWHCYDRATFRQNGQHNDAVYPNRHIVHGHEQWEEGPILKPGRSDLDTFAWLTGRLAIGVFTKEQGPPVEILWAEGPRDPRYD